MNRSVRVLAVVLVVLGLFTLVGCNKLKARDQLNKGVNSFKNVKYEEAVEHFKNAVSLDPTLLNARLYLATAYAQQYIPGAETPENTRNAELAIQEFENVLKENPPQEQQLHSLKGIASLYFNMKQMDKAKDYHKRVIGLDPNDPESYYSVGVINWTQSYQPRQEERAKIGLQPLQDLNDKKVCSKLREEYWDEVQEGKQMLEKAISLREDYDDAMAYLNLMYREEADLSCEDAGARATAKKTADEWVDKTMAAKKRKADKAAQPGGIVLEEGK